MVHCKVIFSDWKLPPLIPITDREIDWPWALMAKQEINTNIRTGKIDRDVNSEDGFIGDGRLLGPTCTGVAQASPYFSTFSMR